MQEEEEGQEFRSLEVRGKLIALKKLEILLDLDTQDSYPVILPTRLS